MSLNSKQRAEMINQRYVSDVNHPADMSVTVHDIRVSGGGHTVVFTRAGDYSGLSYRGLGKFIRSFPHKLEN